jgi:hypothetical protein
MIRICTDIFKIIFLNIDEGLLERKTVSRHMIRVVVEGKGEAEAEFIRFLAPRTIDSVLRLLPIEGRISVFGGYVYFQIPMKIGNEKSKKIVETGTIAYWPLGNAVCVFSEETRPYSPVNLMGRITKNLDLFKNIKRGTKIRIEKISLS